MVIFTWVWSAAAAENQKYGSYTRCNRSNVLSPIDAQAFVFRISAQNNTSNLGA
ncbi:MAG TPA: hypothetical protein VIP70_06520 [Nitrososphaeraceae archaeon]